MDLRGDLRRGDLRGDFRGDLRTFLGALGTEGLRRLRLTGDLDAGIVSYFLYAINFDWVNGDGNFSSHTRHSVDQEFGGKIYIHAKRVVRGSAHVTGFCARKRLACPTHHV